MKFRMHRGGLAESTLTLIELEGFTELVVHCNKQLKPLSADFPVEAFKVEKYFDGPDDRIDWDETHLVTIEGYGPIGFTDQACTP
jgi:hypothetical protein